MLAWCRMARATEHRLEMPVVPAADKAAAELPEKRLNRFVHFVAMMERFGNALGTLAFTWATVVLLGGYSEELRRDFYVATAIIFLEAVRMFSRNNRLDYQLFFRTRGAFRSLGWNTLILLLCFLNELVWIDIMWGSDYYPIVGILTCSMVILVIVTVLCPEAAMPTICNPLRRMISLWSPVVTILLLFPSVLYWFYDHSSHRPSFKISIANLLVYLVLFAAVFVLTVSRLRFPTVIKLADSALGSKIACWRQVIMNVCMFAAIVMSLLTFPDIFCNGVGIWVSVPLDIFALMIASFGNLQIPAALLRVGMALWGLRGILQDLFGSYEQVNTNHVDKTNLLPSLNIFYGMVLGQGMLYIIAGILEIFSFILRRSLVSCAGLRGLQGVQCVNLYYAYAFNKCMEGVVLVPEKTSLITFAVDSLESESPKMQLYGLKMLISFLKKEPLKTRTKTKLTTSMKTVTFLVNMLGWTSEGDKVIRSLAAKVTAEIADNLRVVPVPGAMQLIASLLETVHVQKLKNPLLDIGIPEGRQGNLIEEVVHDEQTSPMLWLKQMALYCLLPREEPSNVNEQNSHILECWKRITECWSIPEEQLSTDLDLLPVQGMLILDRLASFDLDSCTEIYKAPGLISKVIEFTSNRTDMPDINEIHQTILKTSSLKVLRRLSSTEGKFGVTLRQKISEHPFLLSHLAEILDDNASSHELRDIAIELLRNLAMERNINEEIGSIPVIISKLMHAFFSQGAVSSTEDSGQLLPGQALAVLAMGSASNCLAMLAEKGDVLIKELTDMIKDDRCRYVASSLLRDICVHARSKLRSWDLKEISSILRKVLDLIMCAEGADLEVLVGVSSQICKVIPEDFERELEYRQMKERFIKRLVNVLNTNRTPGAHCPGIRRVVVEHAIYMMEYNPGYTGCFIESQMMGALLQVERKPSRAENYKFFLGDAGLMKHGKPLSALVSRAKELMKP